mgnify:FL=1
MSYSLFGLLALCQEAGDGQIGSAGIMRPRDGRFFKSARMLAILAQLNMLGRGDQPSRQGVHALRGSLFEDYIGIIAFVGDRLIGVDVPSISLEACVQSAVVSCVTSTLTGIPNASTAR